MPLDSQEQMLAALVARPSSSSSDPRFDISNRSVTDLLATWAESIGGRVELRPVTDDKWNLVVRFGPDEGEGGLVLAGHSDTVPWDDAGWSSDPFRLTERDGALFGLGSADMKGFFPAALHAIAGVPPPAIVAPLLLVATCDEESTMIGARALADERRLAGASVVIGEPTGLVPVHAHKGVAHLRVRTEGRSGHASDPHAGVNAIDAMVLVLEALVRHRAELADQRDARFAVPEPTLNFGHIAGGDSPNRICGSCVLDLDLRLLPGTSVESATDAVRAVVREAVRDASVRCVVERLFDGVPPFATSSDAAILRYALAITGADARAVPFATEAPHFAALGKDVIVLGPGSIEVAHRPDENVSRADLHRATEVYSRLIRATCTGSGA